MLVTPERDARDTRVIARVIGITASVGKERIWLYAVSRFLSRGYHGYHGQLTSLASSPFRGRRGVSVIGARSRTWLR